MIGTLKEDTKNDLILSIITETGNYSNEVLVLCNRLAKERWIVESYEERGSFFLVSYCSILAKAYNFFLL